MGLEDYKEFEHIGGGGFAITYRARDSSGDLVCLKEFDLSRFRSTDNSWQPYKLFQREAEVLEEMDHSQIPDFKEFFSEKDEKGKEVFYLAMDYVEGENLRQIAEKGKLTESEVVDIAYQVNEVFRYLHSFNPPKIHRDIKPANLIRKEDGTIMVVDFGSVKNEIAETVGGSTSIGTQGYIAPETNWGHAEPKTDYLALGTTMAYLLTGKKPKAFVNSKGQFELTKKNSGCSKRLCKLINKMTIPDLEKRLGDYDEIKKELNELGGKLVKINPNVEETSADLEKTGQKEEFPLSNRILVERDHQSIDMVA